MEIVCWKKDVIFCYDELSKIFIPQANLAVAPAEDKHITHSTYAMPEHVSGSFEIRSFFSSSFSIGAKYKKSLFFDTVQS